MHAYPKHRFPLNLRLAPLTATGIMMLATWATTTPACAAPDFTGAVARVDTLFQPHAGEDRPGCAVGVISDGQFVFKNAYGMASLEYGVPLSSRSVFRVASLSKQFTAMAIAILSERGDLSLDADVHTYLPELMGYGHVVTIRQMLHHTSGMADYGDSPALYRNASGEEFRWGNEDYLSSREFLERILKTPLVAAPETEFRYSNFGYFLLGQVVERVSGMSLRRFAEQNIFAPLSMRASSFNDSVNRVIRNVATAYQRGPDGQYEIYMTNLDWVGDGGVYTNIEDFIRWDRNFYSNALGRADQALVELMQAPGKLPRRRDDTAPTDYGFGQELDYYRGERRIAHGGSWVGYTSYYVRFPGLRLSVVTFCNALDAQAGDLGKQVADIYLDILQSTQDPPTGN